MYIGLYVKYRLFLPDFNKTRNFLDRFLFKSSNIKSDENPSLESRVFLFSHADGQTDMTKLNLDFKETEWEIVGPIRFIWLRTATRDGLS